MASSSAIPPTDRAGTARGGGGGGSGRGDAADFGGVRQLGGDAVEKVLTIEPGEGATLRFKVDYVKGGMGGQAPPGVEGMPVSRRRCARRGRRVHLFFHLFSTHVFVATLS